MMTTRRAPPANSPANAVTSRAPRLAPTCGRNATRLPPTPWSHWCTNRASRAGVNHTVVRYPAPAAERTTWRPSRQYTSAAAEGPMSSASRVFTRPGIGALTKMPSALRRTPAREPARRHAQQVESDQHHVGEPGTQHAALAVAPPRRDERPGQRTDFHATPLHATNHFHVFHDFNIRVTTRRVEQLAPDQQSLVAVRQVVQPLPERLPQLDEPLPRLGQIDGEAEHGDLGHGGGRVHDGGEQGATRCGGHADIGVEEQEPLAPHRSEEHTSELQSRLHLVCRLLLEKKKRENKRHMQ